MRVVRVIDGDTLEAEVSRRLRVRLLDCWAPELREPGGHEAQSFLAGLVAGQTVTLQVPTEHELQAAFSFGRVLGRIWIGGNDVSRLMIEAGHATREK